MKSILSAFIVLFTIHSHAGIVGMLSATELNMLFVKMAKVNGEPVMALAQTYNESSCRPSFAAGSVFAEDAVITEINGVTKITLSLLVGDVCGDQAKLQKILPGESLAKGYVSYHNLKSLIQQFSKQNTTIANYLESHPGVLNSEKVEVEFYYQYFKKGTDDSSLRSFTVPFYNLSDKFEIYHNSPIQ